MAKVGEGVRKLDRSDLSAVDPEVIAAQGEGRGLAAVTVRWSIAGRGEAGFAVASALCGHVGLDPGAIVGFATCVARQCMVEFLKCQTHSSRGRFAHPLGS